MFPKRLVPNHAASRISPEVGRQDIMITTYIISKTEELVCKERNIHQSVNTNIGINKKDIQIVNRLAVGKALDNSEESNRTITNTIALNEKKVPIIKPLKNYSIIPINIAKINNSFIKIV